MDTRLTESESKTIKTKSFFYIPFLFTLSFNKTYGTIPSSNAEYLVFILLDYLHRC